MKKFKRLINKDTKAEVTNKRKKILANGTTIFSATIKRKNPIVDGK